MVVFTCNNCGETLQKPRVAKHYQFQCRTTAFLTCVDCFKDFRGDEYVAHTKCITEAQRYGGKDYVPKANANKGERKQQEWINVVNNLLEGTTELSNAERGFLNALSRHENIPRKRAKFLNFIRSAMGQRTNVQVVESVWNKMELAYKNSTQNSVQNEQSSNGTAKENCEESMNESLPKECNENNIAENQNNENICRENGDDVENRNNESNGDINGKEKSQKVTKVKKSKKRGISEVTEEPKGDPVSKKKSKSTVVLSESSANQGESASEKATFDWKDTILSIVQSKSEISLKKLQKKVVSKYMNHCSDAVTQEKASSKFNKKLKKMTEVIVSEEKVTLA